MDWLDDEIDPADRRYIDSRGAEMPFMSFSEALEILHDVAKCSTVPPIEAASAERYAACDTLHDLVVNHADALDALRVPVEAGEYPDAVWQSDEGDDPSQVLPAVKIVIELASLSMGRSADGARIGIDEAEQIDRANQAMDLAKDLLGLHGATLEKEIRLVPIPPSMT